MIKKLTVLIIVFYCFGCTNSVSTTFSQKDNKSTIVCNENGCTGSYSGAEFVNNDDDIAHQFSNKMSKYVGDKLKQLYKKGFYCKVDFSKIKMSTEGMGSGTVVYKLSIPFMSVEQKCDAFTSFDHVGGWGHPPALTERKKQLKTVLLKGESLDISDLKTTPEGLQEYWIQWKNNTVQANCVK